jgi:predicted porin
MSWRLAAVLLAISGYGVEQARAQSSGVTVYGIADAFVASEKTSSQSAVTRLSSGGRNGSILGFRANEDLGSGLTARAVLETAFAIDTGATKTLQDIAPAGTNGLFAHSAHIALASKDWGTVAAGRQYTPAFAAIFQADPFGYNDRLSIFGRVAGTMNRQGPNAIPIQARAGNSVAWKSPSWNGMTVHLLHGFGEMAGNHDATSQHSANLLYQSGPVYAGIAWSRAYNTPASVAAAPVASRSVVLAGSYDFGKLKLFGTWNRNMAPRSAANVDSDNLQLGMTMWLGPADQVLASVVRRQLKNSPDDARALMLGYDHHLSKRTALYARAGGVDNRGNAGLGLDDMVPAAGNSVRLVGFGVRHLF